MATLEVEEHVAQDLTERRLITVSIESVNPPQPGWGREDELLHISRLLLVSFAAAVAAAAVPAAVAGAGRGAVEHSNGMQ